MSEKQQKLSAQPYKGARDFYPEDMRIQNYIFDTWKKVCCRYGFEQYDFPILEPLEVFSSKTGEEIVNEQLFSFEDKGGRKLAIRPEITPSTVRMIAQKYKEIPQPIKWFMVGSNWRFEKPQLGRGREFYQLEANIFGVSGVEADFEIFSLIIAIMKEFGAKENMFGIRISDRRIVGALLRDDLDLKETTQEKVRRLMDKRNKLNGEDFSLSLKDLGLNSKQIQKIEDFLYQLWI
jgi:histidyl-tRNA synthetase